MVFTWNLVNKTPIIAHLTWYRGEANVREEQVAWSAASWNQCWRYLLQGFWSVWLWAFRRQKQRSHTRDGGKRSRREGVDPTFSARCHSWGVSCTSFVHPLEEGRGARLTHFWNPCERELPNRKLQKLQILRKFLKYLTFTLGKEGLLSGK